MGMILGYGSQRVGWGGRVWGGGGGSAPHLFLNSLIVGGGGTRKERKVERWVDLRIKH